MSDYLRREAGVYADRLEFTGNVNRDQLAQVLQGVDICVFPSRWESFGFVVLEAIAAGKAVVCSDNAGMAELVEHGKYGVVCPPKSPRKLADAILSLLKNPERRQNLARSARQDVLPKYLPEQVLKQQLACYEFAIAKGNVGP